MVHGLDVFKTHFAGYEENYLLIGGTASDLLMNDAGLDFRATKDLDIILCVEALSEDFAKAFWRFIEAGSYEHEQVSTGRKIFYRFNKPSDTTFPAMLELFAREFDDLPLPPASHLTPVPTSADVPSLSAILLDDTYYAFVMSDKRTVDGIRVVSPACIIPLKVKAFLDLKERKEAGDKVDNRDIKKHKNDVLKLSQLIAPQLEIEIPNIVKTDMGNYIDNLKKDPVRLKDIGVDGTTLEQIIELLKEAYQLT